MNPPSDSNSNSSFSSLSYRPILLFTDPGRDIDDILALFLLRHFSRNSSELISPLLLNHSFYSSFKNNFLYDSRPFKLVGAISTGENNHLRLKILRGWLKLLKFPSIPTTNSIDSTMNLNSLNENKNFNSSSTTTGGVFLHSEFQNEENNEFTEYSCSMNSTELIYSLLKEYSHSLIFYCIGPLTPIAEFLKIYSDFGKFNIHSILIQGQIEENNNNINYNNNDNNENNESNNESNNNNNNNSIPIRYPLLIPSRSSFNFHCDYSSAQLVFQILSPYIPFILLGKYTAYKISLHHNDLFPNQFISMRNGINNNNNNNEINEISISSWNCVVDRLKSEYLGCMKLFYNSNPTLFEKLYFHSETENKNNNSDTTVNSINSSSTTSSLSLSDTEFYNRLQCLSHPYDPLLLFSWRFPQYFQFREISLLNNNNSSIISTENSSEFHFPRHFVIGMNENQCGIRDENTDGIQKIRELFSAQIREEMKILGNSMF